jgi:hypothetical protein
MLSRVAATVGAQGLTGLEPYAVPLPLYLVAAFLWAALPAIATALTLLALSRELLEIK